MIGAFYGASGTPAEQLVLAPGLATIGPTPGVLGNVPPIFPLPGTEPAQVVSLQIRAWYSPFGADWRAARDQGFYYGETDVRQVTLGTATLPALIWQAANGTLPDRFTPLGPILGVPEPSAVLLGAVAGVLLLLVRARSSKRR